MRIRHPSLRSDQCWVSEGSSTPDNLPAHRASAAPATISCASSASCTPRAPSRKLCGNGASAATWRRNISHCTLNALSNSALSGTAAHSSRNWKWIGQIRVPYRPRRIHAMLYLAVAQSCHGAALRAVHLQAQKLVAIHARGPRGVDLRKDPALQLEHAVCRVFGRALVCFAGSSTRSGMCVAPVHRPPAPRQMCGPERNASGRTCPE